MFFWLTIAHAATLEVPGDHATIAQALLAAEDGDVVAIAAGTWTESLRPDVDVTLRGEGADQTVLVADGDAVFTTALVKLTLEDLTVRGEGAVGVSQVGGRLATDGVVFADCDPAVEAEGYGGDAVVALWETTIRDGAAALALTDTQLELTDVTLQDLTDTESLVTGTGGSWALTDVVLEELTTEGALLEGITLDEVDIVRLAARCAHSGPELLKLDAPTSTLDGVLVYEVDPDGVDPTLLSIEGDGTLRYATLLGDGSGSGVGIVDGTLTLEAVALSRLAAGVDGVGTAAASGAWNLLDADSAGAGAIGDEEVLGDTSVQADPDFYVWTPDGDCSTDQLAPGAESPLRDAGPPSETDIDGSRADIGATGGPDGWVLVADADGDGASEVVDCDDSDERRYPDAEDTPGDGIDQDCDGADATEAPVDEVEPTGRWVPRSCTSAPAAGFELWMFVLPFCLRRRRW